MLNSTTWLYGAEVLPIALRSKVMGLAASSHFIVNVASMLHPENGLFLNWSANIFSVTEAGPSAFANIHENYYYVFVVCSAFFLAIAYFYFPETKQKTLEEVAAAFGDRVVDQDESAKRAADVVGEAQHVESTNEIAKSV